MEHITKGYRAKSLYEIHKKHIVVQKDEWVHGSCAINKELKMTYILVHLSIQVADLFRPWLFVEVNNLTLCRLTPYRDSLKRRIYEHDLVRLLSNNAIFLGEVVLKNSEWGLRCLRTNKFLAYRDLINNQEKLEIESFEVMGNIFDNQALIRGYLCG